MKPRLLNFLLVEDNEDHAELILSMFEESRINNHIDHVDDGEKALAYLDRGTPYENALRPDVILLDLNLPKVSGFEVLAKLKNEARLRTIPVVVLTTSTAEADRLKAYESHVNSYLTKPVNFDSFQKMIQDLNYYWGVWNQPSY